MCQFLGEVKQNTLCGFPILKYLEMFFCWNHLWLSNRATYSESTGFMIFQWFLNLAAHWNNLGNYFRKPVSRASPRSSRQSLSVECGSLYFIKLSKYIRWSLRIGNRYHNLSFLNWLFFHLTQFSLCTQYFSFSSRLNVFSVLSAFMFFLVNSF